MGLTQADITSNGWSEEALAQYQNYGITVVPQVLDPVTIATLRDTFTQHAESTDDVLKDVPQNLLKDDPLKKFPRFMHPHRHTEVAPGRLARDLLMDPRILDIVEKLGGPAYGAQTMFYFKPPGSRGQAMHQDNYHLQAHPDTCIAAWIAVDDVNVQNGGLAVVPGSHRQDILCHGASDLSTSFSPIEILLPDGVDIKAQQIQTDMKAGDVLFFHGSLIHGSLPNTTTDQFRRVSNASILAKLTIVIVVDQPLHPAKQH